MRSEMESSQAARVLIAMIVGHYDPARQFVIAQAKSQLEAVSREANVEVRLRLILILTRFMNKIVSKCSDEVRASLFKLVLLEHIPDYLVGFLKELDYQHPEVASAVNIILSTLEVLSRGAVGAQFHKNEVSLKSFFRNKC